MLGNLLYCQIIIPKLYDFSTKWQSLIAFLITLPSLHPSTQEAGMPRPQQEMGRGPGTCKGHDEGIPPWQSHPGVGHPGAASPSCGCCGQ